MSDSCATSSEVSSSDASSLPPGAPQQGKKTTLSLPPTSGTEVNRGNEQLLAPEIVSTTTNTTGNITGSKRYQQLDAHIGQGTYGKVEKARDLLDGEIVAIKKVKVEASSSDLGGAGDDSGTGAGFGNNAMVASVGIHFTVLREIKIMRELRHPNVISIKDVFVEGDFINLVMSHMSSDLRKLLERRIRFSEAQIKSIILQILTGVAEMHAHWYMHRDLAPANIFINSHGICKVADFGLSRGFGSPRISKKTPRVVTLWYRAPELLYGANLYQDKVDMWALGCIFGELLQGGKPLLPGTGEIDQLARIFELLGTPDDNNWPEARQLPLFFEFTYCAPKPLDAVFPGVSASALDLLSGLMVLDPRKRLSASQALKHPYFSSLPLPCAPSELPLHLL